MIASIARRFRSISLRAVHRVFTLVLLSSIMSGCLEESPPTTARPTRVRPTATAVTAARPTARPVSNGSSASADWTVLVYLDGDNDLEQSAIDDFAEMSSVGSNDRLNIVVQFDRIESDEDWDDRSNGDWTGVKRFRIEQRKKPSKTSQLDDLGELNMGDPDTLVDFATWGIQTYPAEHYALIFWDHGASWPGIASDDTSDSDMLTLPELTDALGDIRDQTGVQQLDLIGFDACLMGQIDVLQAVAPFGQVAIGSADLEPGEGWAWNAWLKDLARAPDKDAAALAPSIIESFTEFYEAEDDPSVTLAAFDLTEIARMTDQLDTLATAMIETMPDSYTAIGEARAYAAEYAAGDTDISAIDLGYFAESLIDAGAEEQVEDAARALSRTIKAARIAHGYGADHPESSGISVYFPWKKKHYDANYLESSPLTDVTQWDEFLQAFYSAGRSKPKRAAVSEPTLSQPTAAPDDPLSLAATISGSDTAYVSYFVGSVTPEDPDTVEIWTIDYLYPPGAALDGAIPDWSDGDEVELSWQASSWYISNGSEVIRAPFTPIDYGASTYSIEGTYTARKTGKQIPVSVEFEVTQGRGTLQQIWAFDKGSAENARPRELEPRAGDTFTPDLLSYQASGDDFEEQTTAGQPLTFGDTPLIAFEGAAPSGEYVIGLMVEDIAGEISDQYADVTVESPDGDALPAIPAPVPAPEAGSATDTLAFHDEQLGFRLDYPQAWELSSPGSDKVVFFDPEQPDDAYLGVDVYALEGSPDDENRALLDALLEVDAEEPGFELRQESSATTVASRDGLRVEYVYQDRDGVVFHVVGVAVSDAQSESLYLITFDAAEASYASSAAVFEQMLASFTID